MDPGSYFPGVIVTLIIMLAIIMIAILALAHFLSRGDLGRLLVTVAFIELWIVLRLLTGEWHDPWHKKRKEEPSWDKGA